MLILRRNCSMNTGYAPCHRKLPHTKTGWTRAVTGNGWRLFMALADCLSTIFYENEIPPEVERGLETIYQSPFCVTKHFEMFRGVRNLNALVITCGESDLRHVIAYVISGREITVLNELVEIGQEYIQHFADAVFNRYPMVSTLNFNCIKSRIVDLNYPWRRWKSSQDIAIELP